MEAQAQYIFSRGPINTQVGSRSDLAQHGGYFQLRILIILRGYDAVTPPEFLLSRLRPRRAKVFFVSSLFFRVSDFAAVLFLEVLDFWARNGNICSTGAFFRFLVLFVH